MSGDTQEVLAGKAEVTKGESIDTVETQTSDTDPLVEGGKDAIYIKIQDLIFSMTQKRVGKTGGRKVFDKVVEEIFSAATALGTFRFNAGFGSLHTRNYGAGTRKLPSGQMTSFDERSKLRYEEGVMVQALVKSGGDLEEAKRIHALSAEQRASTAKESENSDDKSSSKSVKKDKASKPKVKVMSEDIQVPVDSTIDDVELA